MSKITHILGESNTEKVRTQIAYILADELSNQKALIEAEVSPTQEMLLTLESIPEQVWEERFIRPSEGEFPLLNVVLLSNPLSELTGLESQTDNAKFAIEYYSKAKSKELDNGDRKASIKLQRLLMICRSIIMDPRYITLDFEPGFIGSVVVGDLQIATPNTGADNGYLINGQITVSVKIEEIQNNIEGVPLNISVTNHRLYNTEKGYYYET